MNRIINFLATLLALLFLWAWIFVTLPSFDWFWPKLMVIIAGWWLSGVVTTLIYEGETYAWDSLGSDLHPIAGPLAIIYLPGGKIFSGEDWTCKWSPWALLGPFKLGVELMQCVFGPLGAE